MNARILNIYSNISRIDSCRGDHGQSFLIEVDGLTVLMDLGMDGEIFMQNARALGVDPDSIDAVVISHGHDDHTGGLPAFLNARTRSEPLPVHAHPAFLTPKYLKLGPLKRAAGVPQLTDEQQAQINLVLSSEPTRLSEHLWISGEITNRDRKEGVEPTSRLRVDGKFVVDPMADDMSLYLLTTKGVVIITGCAHAGILNICEHAVKTTGGSIHAIIGGTHMVRYTEDEVVEAGHAFKSEFGNPLLYLNHCTEELPGKLIRKTPAIGIISGVVGADRVRPVNVGDVVEFA